MIDRQIDRQIQDEQDEWAKEKDGYAVIRSQAPACCVQYFKFKGEHGRGLTQPGAWQEGKSGGETREEDGGKWEEDGGKWEEKGRGGSCIEKVHWAGATQIKWRV